MHNMSTYVCFGLRCKIGPWFKYLNVSNLWSAKYMVGMPWSDWYRRTMYKGLAEQCLFYFFFIIFFK